MRNIHVDWTSYAAVYDLMALENPAYQELLEDVQLEVEKWALKPGMRMADFGAGTGNFSIPIAKQYPQVEVIHIDSDAGMIAAANDKVRALRLDNLRICNASATSENFPVGSFDAVISIHALYAIPDPIVFLYKLRTWLKPGSPAILCNFGRQMQVNDWAWYLFKSMRKRIGTARTIEVFIRGRHVAKQNARIAQKQRQGEYWTHTSEEFRYAVESSGFEVISQRLSYREYSDFLICRANG